MPKPIRKRTPCEELANMPENLVGEIIDGEIIATPRPSRRRINAAASLGGEFIPTYRFGRGGPGGWIIHHEPEVHFGNDVLVPDLAGWRKERLSPPPRQSTVFPSLPTGSAKSSPAPPFARTGSRRWASMPCREFRACGSSTQASKPSICSGLNPASGSWFTPLPKRMR